jgi:hypothetical protein
MSYNVNNGRAHVSVGREGQVPLQERQGQLNSVPVVQHGNGIPARGGTIPISTITVVPTNIHPPTISTVVPMENVQARQIPGTEIIYNRNARVPSSAHTITVISSNIFPKPVREDVQVRQIPGTEARVVNRSSWHFPT